MTYAACPNSCHAHAEPFADKVSHHRRGAWRDGSTGFVCPSHPGLRFLTDLQRHVYRISNFECSLQWKPPWDGNANSGLACAPPYCVFLISNDVIFNACAKDFVLGWRNPCQFPESRFNPGTDIFQFYTPKALKRSYKTAIEMDYFWSQATELEE